MGGNFSIKETCQESDVIFMRSYISSDVRSDTRSHVRSVIYIFSWVGSELNIIKEDVLKDTLNIICNQVFSLTGISKDSILTKGSTEIQFGEVRGTFNVLGWHIRG